VSVCVREREELTAGHGSAESPPPAEATPAPDLDPTAVERREATAPSRDPLSSTMGEEGGGAVSPRGGRDERRRRGGRPPLFARFVAVRRGRGGRRGVGTERRGTVGEEEQEEGRRGKEEEGGAAR
jgi:hypothetical protein